LDRPDSKQLGSKQLGSKQLGSKQLGFEQHDSEQHGFEQNGFEQNGFEQDGLRDRIACVDLPAFALQLLLRRHPGWQGHPVAVVESDRPQARIIQVNERARTFRILPGLRYAAALSLCGGLRAAEVPAADIDRAVQFLVRRLRRFTPEVEPSAEEPGLFWLNAAGLEPLYGSLAEWAHGIREDLARLGLEAAVVVGFTPFGTAAVARTIPTANRTASHDVSWGVHRGVHPSVNQRVDKSVIVFAEIHAERSAARRVPLDRLAIEPAVREDLMKLGIHTVGDFADLPPEGIEKRFGQESARLHRLARGARSLFQPATPEPELRQGVLLDYAEKDTGRLMVLIEQLLPLLVKELAGHGLALVAVDIELEPEEGGEGARFRETVRPAAPTLDLDQIRELIQLRLESARFKQGVLRSGVIEVEVRVHGEVATTEQLELFAEEARRHLKAANRALARVRATFGDHAVVCARLREGHLPEAQFTWEPMARLSEASPSDVKTGTLIRRIRARPLPLPARPRHEPDGWMLRGLREGPVVRVSGPYLVSGGWWVRPVHREYHFAETERGNLMWIFYDRPRRRWFVQGRVE